MAGVYSHSRLGAFRTCPKLYSFQYIEKLTIPERVSADLFMGSAVHRQLETAYKLAGDGVLLPLDDMLTSYRQEWDKTGREKIRVATEYLSVEDYIATGEKLLRRFYEQFQPFDQGTLLGAELQVFFQLPGTPFRFRSRIDRLWKRDDGVIEICDYKTGKHLPLGVRDPAFYVQMGIYQLAVQDKYPQFETIETAQYFLRHEEAIRHRFTPEELDELTEELRQNVLATIRAEKLDRFPTREGGHCHYCEYASFCPAKRHRLILEEEETTDGNEPSSARMAADLARKFLELDSRYKTIKAEHQALKEDLIRIAEDLDIDKIDAESGTVSVKRGVEQKFITRSVDPQAHTALTSLVRNWQLDEALKLDENALMKDFYLTERLTPDQLEQLKEFVVTKHRYRVVARPDREEERE